MSTSGIGGTKNPLNPASTTAPAAGSQPEVTQQQGPQGGATGALESAAVGTQPSETSFGVGRSVPAEGSALQNVPGFGTAPLTTRTALPPEAVLEIKQSVGSVKDTGLGSIVEEILLLLAEVQIFGAELKDKREHIEALGNELKERLLEREALGVEADSETRAALDSAIETLQMQISRESLDIETTVKNIEQLFARVQDKQKQLDREVARSQSAQGSEGRGITSADLPSEVAAVLDKIQEKKAELRRAIYEKELPEVLDTVRLASRSDQSMGISCRFLAETLDKYQAQVGLAKALSPQNDGFALAAKSNRFTGRLGQDDGLTRD